MDTRIRAKTSASNKEICVVLVTVCGYGSDWIASLSCLRNDKRWQQGRARPATLIELFKIRHLSSAPSDLHKYVYVGARPCLASARSLAPYPPCVCTCLWWENRILEAPLFTQFGSALYYRATQNFENWLVKSFTPNTHDNEVLGIFAKYVMNLFTLILPFYSN